MYYIYIYIIYKLFFFNIINIPVNTLSSCASAKLQTLMEPSSEHEANFVSVGEKLITLLN